GDLNQDAGAVAGVHLAAARAAVLEVDEDLKRLPDDRVGALSLDVHDEADATRVVLGVGIVQPLGGRRTIVRIRHGAGVCTIRATIKEIQCCGRANLISRWVLSRASARATCLYNPDIPSRICRPDIGMPTEQPKWPTG